MRDAWSGDSLRKIRTELARFVRDERGQAVSEYVLILSVCVAGATALMRAILNVLDNGLKSLGAQLEKDLKTGRTPTNVWKD